MSCEKSGLIVLKYILINSPTVTHHLIVILVLKTDGNRSTTEKVNYQITIFADESTLASQLFKQ